MLTEVLDVRASSLSGSAICLTASMILEAARREAGSPARAAFRCSAARARSLEQLDRRARCEGG